MIEREIRELVALYLKLSEPPESVALPIASLRSSIEATCAEFASARRTGPWAVSHLGPVLGAGLVAAQDPRDCQTIIRYWRVAGLIRPRHYSVAGAMRFLEAHGFTEQNWIATPEEVERLAVASGRNPAKLPPRPDYADLIHWLNRITYNVFLSEVVTAAARDLMASNSWYQGEARRIREIILNAEDVRDRCRRYIQFSNTCETNDLRKLFEGTPTECMLNHVVELEIAKTFTEKYYRFCAVPAKDHEDTPTAAVDLRDVRV